MPFDLNIQLQGKHERNTEFLVNVLVFCLRVRQEDQYQFNLTAFRDSKDWKLVATAGFTDSKKCNRLTSAKKDSCAILKNAAVPVVIIKPRQELNIERSPLIQLRLADL